jgi:neurofibromin 1
MIGLPYLFRTIAVLLQGMLRDLEGTPLLFYFLLCSFFISLFFYFYFIQFIIIFSHFFPSSLHLSLDQEAHTKQDGDSDVKLFKVQYELDPEKIDETSDENINVLMLQLTCQKFLVQILRSSGDCPGEFKQLCAHIKAVIEKKFPEFIYKAIGSFIFLRFFNTGITVPETYGLMSTPPNPVARRQLILLSKVLQNLANGVKFGSKESFMTKLNGFITANQEKLKGFYDRLCVCYFYSFSFLDF